MEKHDDKAPTSPDNRRSRLFNLQKSDSQNPGEREAVPGQQPPASAPLQAGRSGSRDATTIGATMTLKGDLVGKEDVIVQGKLQGSVVLNENDIVVDESGEVEGNIIARHVLIKGRVDGDIQGLEKVTIAATGQVQQTVAAPRVVLEEGGRFKGMIDMPFDEQGANAPGDKPQALNPAPGKRVETANATTQPSVATAD